MKVSSEADEGIFIFLLFSYIFQALVARGIVVTDDVGTVVEFVGDVGGGVNDLIAVGRVAAEGVYQGLLEMLSSLLLDSFVLHVVGEDEAGIAHLGQLQRGEEDGEAGHELQEEGGGGTELVVPGAQVGDVL